MISERDATTIVAISSNCDRPSLAHGEAVLNLVQNQSKIYSTISEPRFKNDLGDQSGCGRRNYSCEGAIGTIEGTYISLLQVTIELLSFEQLR